MEYIGPVQKGMDWFRVYKHENGRNYLCGPHASESEAELYEVLFNNDDTPKQEALPSFLKLQAG